MRKHRILLICFLLSSFATIGFPKALLAQQPAELHPPALISDEEEELRLESGLLEASFSRQERDAWELWQEFLAVLAEEELEPPDDLSKWDATWNGVNTFFGTPSLATYQARKAFIDQAYLAQETSRKIAERDLRDVRREIYKDAIEANTALITQMLYQQPQTNPDHTQIAQIADFFQRFPQAVTLLSLPAHERKLRRDQDLDGMRLIEGEFTRLFGTFPQFYADEAMDPAQPASTWPRAEQPINVDNVTELERLFLFRRAFELAGAIVSDEITLNRFGRLEDQAERLLEHYSADFADAQGEHSDEERLDDADRFFHLSARAAAVGTATYFWRRQTRRSHLEDAWRTEQRRYYNEDRAETRARRNERLSALDSALKRESLLAAIDSAWRQAVENVPRLGHFDFEEPLRQELRRRFPAENLDNILEEIKPLRASLHLEVATRELEEVFSTRTAAAIGLPGAAASSSRNALSTYERIQTVAASEAASSAIPSMAFDAYSRTWRDLVAEAEEVIANGRSLADRANEMLGERLAPLDLSDASSTRALIEGRIQWDDAVSELEQAHKTAHQGSATIRTLTAQEFEVRVRMLEQLRSRLEAAAEDVRAARELPSRRFLGTLLSGDETLQGSIAFERRRLTSLLEADPGRRDLAYELKVLSDKEDWFRDIQKSSKGIADGMGHASGAWTAAKRLGWRAFQLLIIVEGTSTAAMDIGTFIHDHFGGEELDQVEEGFWDTFFETYDEYNMRGQGLWRVAYPFEISEFAYCSYVEARAGRMARHISTLRAHVNENRQALVRLLNQFGIPLYDQDSNSEPEELNPLDRLNAALNEDTMNALGESLLAPVAIPGGVTDIPERFDPRRYMRLP